MKARILMVDDEPEQVGAFARILDQEGNEVLIAEDDVEAMYFVEEFQPDLIILDVRFDFDERMGLDILKKTREKDKTIPIIMLTGLDDHRLPSDSYNKDADYFVKKSESTESLLALVKRCLRRSRPEHIVIDDYIEIDRGRKSVKKKTGGEWERIHFEPLEYGILEKLVLHPGQVITREALYDEFFPGAEDPAGTLRRYISELRRKLEPNRLDPQYILTKYGIGYRFKDYRRG